MLSSQAKTSLPSPVVTTVASSMIFSCSTFSAAAGAAHLTPSVCAESAVSTCPLVPTASLAAVSAALAATRSPLASKIVSAAMPPPPNVA